MKGRDVSRAAKPPKNQMGLARFDECTYVSEWHDCAARQKQEKSQSIQKNVEDPPISALSSPSPKDSF
jgi:hypothetical protein